jgi:hypothetical protein
MLIDTVGTTDSDLANNASAFADVLVVFLGRGCRCEAIHGDLVLWAWRLRRTMRTIFVLPEFDIWLTDWQSTSRYYPESELLVSWH